MHFANVVQMLEIIDTVYGKRNGGILDETVYPYMWVLSEAKRHAEQSWDRFRRDPVSFPKWGYEISDTYPLSFKPSEVLNGARVDVYCNIKWAEDDLPAKQDIKLRIWSEDQAIAYRPELDAEDVYLKLEDSARSHRGRVVSRFHFDKVDHTQGKSNQYHPPFHMQVGGIPRDYELCWHPQPFDIPRIAHQPMELFLTCQLVACNFFPEKYAALSQELVWLTQLRFHQSTLLLKYYKRCVKAIEDKDSLVDFLRSG